MGGSRFENGLATIIAVVVVFFILSLFIDDEPKCIKSGCNNEQAYGSSYCYSHKRSSYSSGYKSYSLGGSSSSASSSSTKDSDSSDSSSGSCNSRPYSSGLSYSGYDSYDEGYEAISEDDDYDWDRYESDSDYASGVDDAMEDYDW